MAKKKATDAVEGGEEVTTGAGLSAATDKLLAELNKAYGGIARSGAEHADRPRHVIKVSPAFDMAVGGIPEGSWNLLVGPPKHGKSLLALQICAEAQKPENGERPVFYLDVECRVEQRDLHGIKGLKLDQPHFHFLRSQEGRPLTSEDHYKIAERIIKTVPGAVVVFDSVSAMCAPSTMEKGVNEGGDRSSGYKLAAQFCSMMESVVPANRAIVIAVAHQYANTSGYGAGKKDKIPSSFEYQATTKLTIKKMERWRLGNNDTGPQIGLIPELFVNTSALGPPGGEFTLHMRFGVGVDKVWELIQLGTELGKVVQSGAWYNLPWADGVKAHGMQKMYDLLTENPKLADRLHDEIRKATAA